MFRFCPACASPEIIFENKRLFRCPACGFLYYHNTAAAAGCVVRVGEHVLLLSRGAEPAKGRLDLPGGFIEPGEGVIEGLRRECVEELGWDPGPEFSFFASFPNVYRYRDINYNTCDMFFSVSAPALRDFARVGL